jgi:dTDP-4-amino-4,6-dideoxygalactose transaminase
MPISESVASRILCLPLYVGLSEEELIKIVALINQNV